MSSAQQRIDISFVHSYYERALKVTPTAFRGFSLACCPLSLQLTVFWYWCLFVITHIPCLLKTHCFEQQAFTSP